jgi:hypothetical protein
MARITNIPLFKNKSLSAGDTGTSDVIDLRYSANQYRFSLSHTIQAGTSTTCGTTIFEYVGCSTEDGTYVSGDPAAGTSGTIGTAGPTVAGMITPFYPTLTPFMKIIATQVGAGTKGANSVVTAELNVQ